MLFLNTIVRDKKLLTFACKLLLLVLLFISLSLVIEKYIEIQEAKQSSAKMQKLGTFAELTKLDSFLKDGTDVIVFGDSVSHYTNATYTDVRTIGEMLQSIAPSEMKVELISYGAYHTRIYEAFSQYICAQQVKPETVVIPINLRQFSPAWDSRPEYQFEKQISILKAKTRKNTVATFINRFNNLFGNAAASNLAKEEVAFNDLPIFYWDTQIATVKDIEKKSVPIIQEETDLIIKQGLISQYLYHLKPENQNISALTNISKNYAGCGIKLIVYITPLDYEAGTKYIGEDFKKIVDLNIDTLLTSSNLKGVSVLNLVYDLPHERFSIVLIPNEHVDALGKMYIAEKIAQSIKETAQKK